MRAETVLLLSVKLTFVWSFLNKFNLECTNQRNNFWNFTKDDWFNYSCRFSKSQVIKTRSFKQKKKMGGQNKLTGSVLLCHLSVLSVYCFVCKCWFDQYFVWSFCLHITLSVFICHVFCLYLVCLRICLYVLFCQCVLMHFICCFVCI